MLTIFTRQSEELTFLPFLRKCTLVHYYGFSWCICKSGCIFHLWTFFQVRHTRLAVTPPSFNFMHKVQTTVLLRIGLQFSHKGNTTAIIVMQIESV